MDAPSVEHSHNYDSLISRRLLFVIAFYLVASAAAASALVASSTPFTARLVLVLLLLAGFLVVARVTANEIARLDEFGRLLVWRAMAIGGVVAVWFVLFMSAIFEMLGWNLFTIVALGPPEFWLCTAFFIRAAERHYASPCPAPASGHETRCTTG